VTAPARPPGADEGRVEAPVHVGRTVVLLGLIAISILWLQHLLGFQLEKLGWVAGAATLWALMVAVAEVVDEKKSLGRLTDSVKQGTRWLFARLSRPIPLAVVGFLLALLMAMISSVTVRAENPNDNSVVSLAAIGKDSSSRVDTLSREKPTVRFGPLLTTPFGRYYTIRARGFVPSQLAVYPLTGRDVVLGRDLAPSPSVLFRPFAEGFVALEDGGVFRVSRVRDGRAEQLASFTSRDSAASFLLGEPRPISDALLALWTTEAAAGGAPERARAQFLIAWRRPKRVAIRGELAPRDCLVAEIRLQDKLKSLAVVQLTSSALVDVLMQDVTANSVEVQTC
jgi:hypothetical protein